MPFPILGAVGLGSKLLSGFLKGRGQDEQADALNEDAQARQEARLAGHEVDERRRQGRLNATQGLLERTGEALPSGAPDYTFDPAVLASLQEARPFTETVGDQRRALTGGTGADPGAGIGSSLAAGFAGGVGDFANTALLGDRPTETPAVVNPAEGLSPEQFNAEQNYSEDTDWEAVFGPGN